jgi:uroporphyrinogen-III synthase
MAGALNGVRIVLGESRELDLLARMVENEGGEAIRCPLVAIVEARDPAAVAAWLNRFVGEPCDDLILLTGEGLGRLAAAARDAGIADPFRCALAAARKITRGPKPVKALRDLGLEPDLRAAEPTTAGVIAALSAEDLRDRRMGVQLYPDAKNELLDFLTSAGARPDPVVPYAYASEAETGRVVAVIERMARERIDVIAFTSSSQVRRLFAVAEESGREPELRAALARIKVAAVGPVVAAELEGRGVAVAVTPAGNFFMKPLIRAIAESVA